MKPNDKTGEEEKREAEKEMPSCYGYQVLHLLSQVFVRLKNNFGNLNSLFSWTLFYKHLSRQAHWWQPIRNFIPPAEDLVNFTTLLFQALNPLRGAFTDGQARIISVAHFIRNVVPCGSNSDWCIDLLCEQPQPSFGAKTTSLANFIICSPAEAIEIEQNHQNLLDDLRAASKSRCEEAKIIEQLYVSDLILNMINRPTFVERAPPSDNESIGEAMHNLFEEIGKELNNFAASDYPQQIFDNVKTALVGKVFRFPMMKTQQSNVSRSLFVLTHFLGAVMADPRSRYDLADLINNSWRPILRENYDSIGDSCTCPASVCLGTSPSDDQYKKYSR